MNSLLRLCLCGGAFVLVALGAENLATDTPPAAAPEGEHNAEEHHAEDWAWRRAAAAVVCTSIVVLAGVLVQMKKACAAKPRALAAGLVKKGVDSGFHFAGHIPLGGDVSKAMREFGEQVKWGSSSKDELKHHDMVIDLEHLGDITDAERGWPISIRGKAVFNKLSDCSTLKVAVIGMYNRGKTYILSQLAGAQLEHGRLVHTVGLSVVLNKANTILFMDTAGENRAVVVDSKTEEDAEAEIRRRVLGVQFQLDVVLEIADVVIVVVNQLTLEDQRHVSKVAKKLKKFKQEKQMIVIHNFKDTNSDKDLAELEERDIQSACGAVRAKDDPWWKTERFNALHVSMASTNSPFGVKLNHKTLAWVSNQLEARIPMMRTDVLVASFMNKFVEVTQQWFPIFFDGLPDKDLKDKLCLKHNTTGNTIFHLGPDCHAKLREDLQVVEWECLNHLKVYELPYEVFQFKHETRVQVEIPGVFREDPLSTEAVKVETSQDNFRAKFSWMEKDEKVLNVSVCMAAKGEIPPGLVIDALRLQPPCDTHEPKHWGTSMEHKGKAQLKIDFTDIKGPTQFVKPAAIVHRNGLLIVTLGHVVSEEEFQLPHAPSA